MDLGTLSQCLSLEEKLYWRDGSGSPSVASVESAYIDCLFKKFGKGKSERNRNLEKLSVLEQTRFQRETATVSNYFHPLFLLKSLHTERLEIRTKTEPLLQPLFLLRRTSCTVR